MAPFFHSVRLDADKCKGCTNCIKHCPTEAIRVRDGKAYILEDRCVDCGACIRVCPNHAKIVHTDSLSRCTDFAYNVALPAPALFGQFAGLSEPGGVLDALLDLGFDEVFEVPLAADLVSQAMSRFVTRRGAGPWISATCPAVVRLIQVRFPELIPNLITVESPMEVAGVIARQKAIRLTGLPSHRIGVWFITPCPAKVTAIHQPEALTASSVTGAIAISQIYGDILKLLPGTGAEKRKLKASGLGLGWGRAGGENVALGIDNHLAVDGIHNVIALLEELEMGRLQDIHFLECQACTGGCVGGALTVENPFIARVRLRKLAGQLPQETNISLAAVEGEWGDVFSIKDEIVPRPMTPLATDMYSAIAKMERLETIERRLPGLDCGACGAPNCRALAEDIVRGRAREKDCVIKMRELWLSQPSKEKAKEAKS
ncbi:MAG TPA: 4Fe-4S binding protein [Firmicutes bacterium]|nr:4Fe-4S binding protein [Bacillota bacterium]